MSAAKSHRNHRSPAFPLAVRFSSAEPLDLAGRVGSLFAVLTQRLDIPFYTNHLSAFAVQTERLVRFREAYRVALVEGQLDALRALWSEVRVEHKSSCVRWRVDAELVSHLALVAIPLAAQSDRFKARLPELQALVDSAATHHDIPPNHWFGLEGQAEALEELGHVRQTASTLDSLRAEVFVDRVLELTREETPAWPGLWPQGELSWVRDLRFESRSGVSGHIHNAATDRVVAPASALEQLVDSPFTALMKASSLIRPRVVLEGYCVGPFIESRGPGPFLPMPTAARPIEAPQWTRLPLFEGGLDSGHWAWPLCQDAFLVGEGIEATLKELDQTEPTREHWAEDDTALFLEQRGEAQWQRYLRDVWPGCRERFQELLESCRNEAHAVLLVNTRPDHGFGPALSGRRVERAEAAS